MQQSCRTKNFPINFNLNEIFIRYNDISSIFHSLAVIDKRSEMGSADCSLENEVTNWRLWLSGVETIVDKIVVLLFARYSIQDRCLWPEEQKKGTRKKNSKQSSANDFSKFNAYWNCVEKSSFFPSDVVNTSFTYQNIIPCSVYMSCNESEAKLPTLKN